MTQLKSWGLELWDQIDKVFAYSSQGQEQIESYYRTVTDVHKIYLSLTRKHKVLGTPPSTKTKFLLENSTYCNGYNKLLTCMTEQATVYETQADEIKEQVLNPVKLFIDQLKQSIATQNVEYNKLKANIENDKRLLDRAWARYYQAFVNKRVAEQKFDKIKDDKTVPRVDIEKVQAVWTQKITEFEKMRGEYASQLQTFNQSRVARFLAELPKFCLELEILDRRRAEITTETGLALVNIQKKHLDGTNKCNENIADAFRIIDYRADSTALINSLKTNLLYPPDIVFVDLDKVKGDTFNHSDFPGILQQGGKIEKNDSAKSLFGGNGMRGIEAKDMLLEQVKIKLDELNGATQRVTKSLTGLKTLMTSYTNNPSMGDKASLEPQVDVNERQILSLNETSEMLNKHFQKIGGESMTTYENQVSKIDRGAESDGSFDDDDDFDGQEEDDTKPSTNMAKVLYDFDAIDSQQLSIKAETKVKVVTYDDSGSGWTLVQDLQNPAHKGYVPTNYIKMT